MSHPTKPKDDPLSNGIVAMPFDNSPFFVKPVIFGSRYGLTIVTKCEPDIIQALLPPPLVPSGTDLLLQYNFNTITAPVEVEYGNATLMIPTNLGEKPGLFIPRIYEGSEQSAMLSFWGREIWGFPKIAAHVKVSREGQNATAQMSALNGFASASIEIEITETSPTTQPENTLEIYCQKLIPAPDGTKFDVKQIVEIPFKSMAEHHLPAKITRCEVVLDIGGSKQPMAVGDEATAFWYDQDAGSRLELGNTVHDYLQETNVEAG